MYRTPILLWLLVSFCPLTVTAADIDPQSIVFLKCIDSDGKERSGSGAIVSAEGHVLTAKHVAPPGSDCKARRGTRDAEPTRSLTPTLESPRHDYAILKFSKRTDETFNPVSLATRTDGLQGEAIEIWGFPEGGEAAPSLRSGTISNTELDDNGLLESLTITNRGMSGGPVLSHDRLIGLVARADFDSIGTVTNYAILAVEAFRSDVQDIRNDVKADEHESRLAAIEEQLRNDSVCNKLLRDALREKHPDLFSGLSSTEWTPPHSELTDEAEFWVTITTGPAQWLDCKEDSLRKSHFFPMGLVLRPLRDVSITNPDGSQKVWTIFQTEYGLLVLIDRNATAPVTKDTGYVFAIGNGVFKLCGPEDDATCDPGQDLPPLNHNGPFWPYLSGWDSYLRTDDPERLMENYSEYLAFRENQLQIQENNPRVVGNRHFVKRQPTRLEDDPACAVQQAYLYEFDKLFDPYAPDQNSEYSVPVRFSFCNLPPEQAPIRTAGYRPVKVITDSLARKMFDSLWLAEVRNSPYEIVKQLVEVLPGLDRPHLELVRCGQNVDDLFTFGTAASNQGRIALGEVIADEARAERAPPGRNMEYRFRLFQPSQGRSPSKTLSDVPLFQDVDLEIFCGDDREPMRAQTVRIHFRPVFDQPLTLDMRIVENAYVESFESYGFERRRYIEDGYIERICDYPEYYFWLNVLRKELKKDPVILNSTSRLAVDKETIADHFAHLILATLFFTEVELQTQLNPFGGCPQ